MIHPTKVTTPKDAFEERNIPFEYVRGYRENSTAVDRGLLRNAVEQTEKYDTVLVFAGLTDYVESEGCDRENMRLPENQLELIRALAETGKKIIVVLFGGSVVEIPFADQVQAILHMFLPDRTGEPQPYDYYMEKLIHPAVWQSHGLKLTKMFRFQTHLEKEFRRYTEKVFCGIPVLPDCGKESTVSLRIRFVLHCNFI